MRFNNLMNENSDQDEGIMWRGRQKFPRGMITAFW